jgi:small conductance mechanosensitive channel
MQDMITWFTENSVAILAIAALGLTLLLLARRYVYGTLLPKIPEVRANRVQGVTSRIFWLIGGFLLAVIVLATVSMLLERAGRDDDLTTPAIMDWFLDHGILVLIILIVSYLVYRMLLLFIPQMVDRSVKGRGRGRSAREEQVKRAQTLSNILKSVAAVFIVIVALMTILSEFNINITPLLAGAGVAGIAIGFGAQSVVKDFLAGLFILLEDQYNEGDVVKVAGVTGMVEVVNFRRTVLRDLDGIVHSVPNGEITLTSNYTREWSRVNLDIPVAYGEDVDHVMAVITRVGEELAQDKYFGKLIRSAPKALRLNKFGDSSMDIKVVGDTKPSMQWEVAGELRKRIKKAFDEEGIEIPYPHVKLYMGDANKGMLTCADCQHPNLVGSLFCSKCGHAMTSGQDKN